MVTAILTPSTAKVRVAHFSCIILQNSHVNEPLPDPSGESRRLARIKRNGFFPQPLGKQPFAETKEGVVVVGQRQFFQIAELHGLPKGLEVERLEPGAPGYLGNGPRRE